jgi:4-aminobutyrate aminotransferase-like enzyme
MTQREIFLRHVAQTSTAPLALEIVKAEGALLFDINGKEYIDLIGGISVANVGHRHPKVIQAIKDQLDAYLHVMVYGEFVEAPQVQYARQTFYRSKRDNCFQQRLSWLNPGGIEHNGKRILAKCVSSPPTRRSSF